MAARSMRNKVRWQGDQALKCLIKAEHHLVDLSIMANEKSSYIEDNLPLIVTALVYVSDSLRKFNDGL